MLKVIFVIPWIMYDAKDIGSPGAKRTALYFIFIYYYVFNFRNTESLNVEDLCRRIYTQELTSTKLRHPELFSAYSRSRTVRTKTTN